MSAKQITSLAGSVVLFLGVFTPIVNVPIVGSLNYYQNGNGDGVLVLLLSISSMVLVALKKYTGLWFTGGGSLAVMAFTYGNFQSKLSELKRDVDSQLGDNPFRGLADLAVQSVQLQWGWGVLILGAGMVIFGAAIRDDGHALGNAGEHMTGPR